jgi:hypothetical protein
MCPKGNGSSRGHASGMQSAACRAASVHSFEPAVRCAADTGSSDAVLLGPVQNAAAAIDAKANVCSVQFSPTDANLMAFGGANYRTYLYDLRHIQVCCSCATHTLACLHRASARCCGPSMPWPSACSQLSCCACTSASGAAASTLRACVLQSLRRFETRKGQT